MKQKCCIGCAYTGDCTRLEIVRALQRHMLLSLHKHGHLTHRQIEKGLTALKRKI